MFEKRKQKRFWTFLTSIFCGFSICISILIHFLGWYTQPFSIKIILFFLCGGVLSFFTYLLINWLIPLFREFHRTHVKKLFIATGLLLIIQGFCFYFYYERIPIFTLHTLQIKNISTDTENGEWLPVEVTSITDSNGSSILLEELEIIGDYWEEDGNILLKPGSSLVYEEKYIGGLEISLREGDRQGDVLIIWDNQIISFELGAQGENEYKLLLPASTLGSPDLYWRGIAYLSSISDFVTIYFLILLFISFFLLNYSVDNKIPPDRSQKLPFTWIDISIIVLFVVVSLVLTLNLYGGHFSDYTRLSGDAGNYASFAAAQTYPSLFENDPLLSTPTNFDMFDTYHVALTQLVEPVFGNFGTAFMVTQLPFTFLFLFGFYLLGRELYHSRLFGVFLSSLTFIFVQMNLSEFWGYVTSPIPRFSYQVFLPFLLLLVLKKGSNPKNWWIILGLSGAGVYIHAVSAPAWSIAVMLSLWFLAPRSIPFNKRFVSMIIAIGVFVLVMAPFAIQYFSNTSFGEQEINSMETVYEIIDYRLARGMVDVPTALHDFWEISLSASWLHVLLLSLGLFSLIVMNYVTRFSSESRNIIALQTWIAGILIVSVLFPMLDFMVASLLDRNPFQIQLLRGMRNIFPLLYMLFLYPLAYAYHYLKNRKGILKLTKYIIVLFCVLFICVWGAENEFEKTPLLSRTMACWKNGMFVCPEDEELAVRADFFAAIKEQTPEGSRILSDDLAVRYYSLRPLAFSKKDGATFSFSNHQALLEWYEYALLYDELWYLQDDRDAYLDAYTDFAKIVDADYVVLEEPYSEQAYYPEDLILSYSNQGFSLFAVVD